MTQLDTAAMLERVKSVNEFVEHYSTTERGKAKARQLVQDVEALVEYCKFLDDCVGINRRMFKRCNANLEQITADNVKLRQALNKIAQWYDGPVVNSSFDAPGYAELAREALSISSPVQEDSLAEKIDGTKTSEEKISETCLVDSDPRDEEIMREALEFYEALG